ncbi:MAG: hypothetical protein KDA63_18855 [Planctomycetales bacterium]|nr:hypothetical protein [Planctomycetales bacterium]
MVNVKKAMETTQPLAFDELIEAAEERIRQGLAPPPEIYQVKYRRRVDWTRFPLWAQPLDPEIFDGCGHEG